MNPIENLRKLNYKLPKASSPGGNYVSVNIRKNVAYIAIQFPIIDGEFFYQGRLGDNLSTQDGYKAMQFISEAVLLSLFSIILAVILVWLFFTPFIDLVNRPIGIEFISTPKFWLSVVGVSLIVGILSGSYPAFYMSALQPSGIFKNHSKGGKGNVFMRNALVTGQFAITTILIISSIVIFQQLNFIRTADVGYSRDQILTVKLMDDNFHEESFFNCCCEHFFGWNGLGSGRENGTSILVDEYAGSGIAD